jgi:hypothetical protein
LKKANTWFVSYSLRAFTLIEICVHNLRLFSEWFSKHYSCFNMLHSYWIVLYKYIDWNIYALVRHPSSLVKCINYFIYTTPTKFFWIFKDAFQLLTNMITLFIFYSKIFRKIIFFYVKYIKIISMIVYLHLKKKL